MLPWMLQNTILAALLALGVALVCRWRRVGPALRHALWVLVLLRLLLPPGVVTWPWRLPTLPAKSAPSAVGAERPEPPALAAAAAPAVGVFEGVEVLRLEAPEDPTADEPAVPAVAAAGTPSAPPDWRAAAWWAALGLWAVGAAVVAARHLHGLARLVRVVRASEPAPPGTVRHVGETAARLGIRPPRVRVVAGLGSPLVAGLLRPVLLWPRELQHRLAEDGMRAVLIHELAHLRRRDHWVRWLEMAAGCVWWWNPLYRLARRRVRHYAELACDAWVLAVLPRARRAYAEALLQVCETVSKTAEPAPALGVGGDPDDFQRRLTMIMKETVSCRVPRRALLALGLVAALAVPGWTLGEPPAPPDEPRAPAAGVFDDPDELDVMLEGVLDLNLDVIKHQPDRDRKLAAIEQQVQALLKEIQALKAERAKMKEDTNVRSAATKALVDLARAREDQKVVDAARLDALKKLEADLKAELARKSSKSREAAAAEGMLNQVEVERKKIEGRLMPPASAHARVAGLTTKSSDKEIILHRVSYTLTPRKAEALAKLLKEFVKGPMLDCSASGDKLTVTTTPENQNVIGRLIKLIQDAPKSK